MPLFLFRQSFPVIETQASVEGSRDLIESDCQKFNYFANTGAMDLTLTSATTATANAEIIIRNTVYSTDPVNIVAGAGITDIDVSGDLGLVIPAGGVGQLKRYGSSNTWAFYGYIEA